MTDDERLEDIKFLMENGNLIHLRKGQETFNTVKWLIEQVENIPSLESYMNTLAKYGDNTRNKLLEVKQENKQLRETLEFYANEENYINGHHDLMGELPSRIQMDEGDLAKEVLGLE